MSKKKCYYIEIEKWQWAWIIPAILCFINGVTLYYNLKENFKMDEVTYTPSNLSSLSIIMLILSFGFMIVFIAFIKAYSYNEKVYVQSGTNSKEEGGFSV